MVEFGLDRGWFYSDAYSDALRVRADANDATCYAVAATALLLLLLLIKSASAGQLGYTATPLLASQVPLTVLDWCWSVSAGRAGRPAVTPISNP